MYKIKRESYLETVKPLIGSEAVKIIYGMKRCGKSSMLTAIRDELLQNGVSKEQCIRYNFGAMRNVNLLPEDELYNNHSSYLKLGKIKHNDPFSEILKSISLFKLRLIRIYL